VHVSNRNVDFAEEHFDLAIRGSEPADSRLVARRLENAELVVVATPDYLARRGTPQVPEDLAGHECIQFELASTGRRPPWSFQRDGRQIDVDTQGGFTCLGDFLATATLVRHGGGLMQAYRFTVQDALASGELVEVLDDYGGTSRPFMLIYPQTRHMPQRVRVFIDFLFAEGARLPG